MNTLETVQQHFATIATARQAIEASTALPRQQLAGIRAAMVDMETDAARIAAEIVAFEQKALRDLLATISTALGDPQPEPAAHDAQALAIAAVAGSMFPGEHNDGPLV